MSDPIKTVIDKMSDELVKVGEAADRKIEKVMEENAQLRELLYKTTHTPFGWCNFSHLHNGDQCGQCEACEHTKKVMKSVREILEGGAE